MRKYIVKFKVSPDGYGLTFGPQQELGIYAHSLPEAAGHLDDRIRGCYIDYAAVVGELDWPTERRGVNEL